LLGVLALRWSLDMDLRRLGSGLKRVGAGAVLVGSSLDLLRQARELAGGRSLAGALAALILPLTGMSTTSRQASDTARDAALARQKTVTKPSRPARSQGRGQEVQGFSPQRETGVIDGRRRAVADESSPHDHRAHQGRVDESRPSLAEITVEVAI
jgi:hypothetical protein